MPSLQVSVVFTALTGLVLIESASIASAGDISPLSQSFVRPPAMRSFGDASPPVGFVNFCRVSPEECAARTPYMQSMTLTAQRWSELAAVNELVNTMIAPASDEEVYGAYEHWAYPKTRGDCEDYVLLKRRKLIERGWPQSTLLIAVVRDEEGEGHAVLIVRTNRGEFVLDNKRGDILPWHRLPYEFVKRQSFRDPALWVSLTPSNAPVLRAAGAEPRR